MKTIITQGDFIKAFHDYDRQDQFSPEALEMLFEHFENYEYDTGEEIELDIVGICCEYAEETWQEVADNYSIDLSDCEDDEEKEQAVIDYLGDHTAFVGNTGSSLVYLQF